MFAPAGTIFFQTLSDGSLIPVLYTFGSNMCNDYNEDRNETVNSSACEETGNSNDSYQNSGISFQESVQPSDNQSRRYTKEEKEKIIAIYRNNDITLNDLATQSGISSSTLKKWTEGLNITGRRSCSVEEKKQAVFHQGNLDVNNLPQKLNISSETLNNGMFKKKYRRYTVDEKKRAIQLYLRENISIKKLSRKLNIPDRTLNDWILNEKLKAAQTNLTAQEKEEILKVYRKGDTSVKDVARKFKIPIKLLYIWLAEEKTSAL